MPSKFPIRLKILSLIPFLIPLIVSVAVAIGVIPVNTNVSKRLPIISSVIFFVLTAVLVWKWKALEKAELKGTEISMT